MGESTDLMEWLEEEVKMLIEGKAKKIVVVSTDEDGESRVGFYQCNLMDLFSFAGLLMHTAGKEADEEEEAAE